MAGSGVGSGAGGGAAGAGAGPGGDRKSSPSSRGGRGGGSKPKTIVGDSPKVTAPKNPFTGKELSPTAHKIMDKRDKARKIERDKVRERKAPSSNPLDALLGYETEEERMAAYEKNPNTPNYDTKTMGVPIADYGLTPTALLSGQNVGMSPGVSAGFNAVASLATGIGTAMGLTRGIQAATGMTGGPSVGGFNDGKLSKSTSRTNNAQAQDEVEKRKKRRQDAQNTLLGATIEDNGLGLDKFGKQVQFLE